MEEEYILNSNWDSIIDPYYTWPSTDYMELMQWLKACNDKPAKAQEISDNIIENYFE